MRKRYVILGLSVVLALALAVPAFGGPTNPIASVKKTAQKALKNANAAKKTANSALTAAESATAGVKGVETEVNKANTEIKKLQTSVTTAQNTANSAKTIAEQAKAAAAAAEANANTRIKDSVEKFGTTTPESESTKFASVSCGANSPTLGGGYEVGGASVSAVTISEENLYEDGWFVGSSKIAGTPAGAWSLRAIAICGTK